MPKEKDFLMRRSRKAISPLLAGVLYVVIGLAAITIVFQVATPAISKLQDASAVDQAKAALLNLDRLIRLVAAEGIGSTRITTLELRKGNFVVDSSSQRLYYELTTPAAIVSPRTRQVLGNLIQANNANASASQNATHLVLQNEHLQLTLSRIGANDTDFQPINVSRVLESVVLRETSANLGGNVSVIIDNNPSYESGTGYTKLEEIGPSLGRARAIAHINSTLAEYDVWFTLESSADFFSVEVRNFLPR